MTGTATGLGVGFALTLAVMLWLGVRSGARVHSSSDFSVGGRRAGPVIVAGAIMGTLVGGASTVGTAQLAYLYGFSAWWFTLGAGIGCLVLGVVFAKPLRASGRETVTRMIADEYGPVARAVSGLCVSAGIFLNVIAQVLAGVSLLGTLTGMAAMPAAAITVVCMGTFVLFGGVWGAGMAGAAKTVLLYAAAILGGVVALALAGGVRGIAASFPPLPWFSLFGRGFRADAAAGFSLVVGVLSTQTYIQAVLSGKTLRASVTGTLASAALIPPIGLAGIVIGLYMRMRHPGLESATVFPRFVLEHLPPWLGGVVFAALFIAAVGTGAGLALGVGVIAAKDLYGWIAGPEARDRMVLAVSRGAIVAILGAALLFISGNLQSLILRWSYLSMGLRGAAILAPLVCALFLKGRVPAPFAVAAIVAGPLGMVAAGAWKGLPVDPLVAGVIASSVVMAAGAIAGRPGRAGPGRTARSAGD